MPILSLLCLHRRLPLRRPYRYWSDAEGTRPSPSQDGANGGPHDMTALRSPEPGDRQKGGRGGSGGENGIGSLRRLSQGAGRRISHLSAESAPAHLSLHELRRTVRSRLPIQSSKPTSLLYKKTADGGYQLVGAMYTDRGDATEEELNGRIPLSIARWHQHINFCRAPPGEQAAYFGPDAKFGLLGSITTKEACDAAGGRFRPHLFGWMVHVYPFQTDEARYGLSMMTMRGATIWTTPPCLA